LGSMTLEVVMVEPVGQAVKDQIAVLFAQSA
jgi:hypothetical protein